MKGPHGKLTEVHDLTAVRDYLKGHRRAIATVVDRAIDRYMEKALVPVIPETGGWTAR